MVAEPTGTDRAALKWLRDDPALLVVVLHPRAQPTPEEAERLQSFVDAHPLSSYAAYGHFALGRYFLRERRAGKRAWRVHEALAEYHLSQALWRVIPHPASHELQQNWHGIRFPYDPDVLRWRRGLCPAEARGWEQELRTRHPEAVEWLDVEAGRLGGAEWDTFRATLPLRKQPVGVPRGQPILNAPRPARPQP